MAHLGPMWARIGIVLTRLGAIARPLSADPSPLAANSLYVKSSKVGLVDPVWPDSANELAVWDESGPRFESSGDRGRLWPNV